MKRRPSQLDTDDFEALFLGDTPASPTSTPASKPVPPATEDFRALVEASLARRPPPIKDDDKPKPRKAPKSSPVVPLQTLNLHGFSINEALEKTRGFLRMLQSANIFTAEIITGRGLHSEDGPKIKPAVKTLLVAFCAAGIIRGIQEISGGGAFRITFRRKSAL